MGSSDHYAMPVLIFSIIYLCFIIGIMALYNGNTPQTYTSTDQSKTTITNLYPIANFINNTYTLGYWNVIAYAPVLAALMYIGIALLMPTWA